MSGKRKAYFLWSRHPAEKETEIENLGKGRHPAIVLLGEKIDLLREFQHTLTFKRDPSVNPLCMWNNKGNYKLGWSQ